MNRDEAIRALESRDERWDVLVIGGGATGLGAAVDAASRGHRTLLLEQHDFAKATSSRSTKLIHGGVRYLRQGNISLVRESLRERALLLRNAPHVTRAQSFVVPAYAAFEKLWYGTGLKLYDALAGRLGIGGSRIISRKETILKMPTLRAERLRGGVQYFDGQFDDARLAIVLAQTVFDLGGVAVNYVRVVRLRKESGRVTGVIARDIETGREFEIAARVVINATGVFADELRRADDAACQPLVAASQGAHLVVPRSFLPGQSALMIPKTADGRVLFAIPWHGRVVIGTTDTPVNGASLEPRPFAHEIEFLLEHAARYLDPAPRESDVLSTFAGLRPLVKRHDERRTARLPRDHTIVVSASGLVTIAGGKWTTFRKMGEDVIDRAAGIGSLEMRRSRTADLRLHGGDAKDRDGDLSGYGGDAAAVRALLEENADWNMPLHPRLPYRAGEVIWAVRHEMARTVEDVLARRTRALILDASAASEAAPTVALLIASELGHGQTWIDEQVRSFSAISDGYGVAS